MPHLFFVEAKPSKPIKAASSGSRPSVSAQWTDDEIKHVHAHREKERERGRGRESRGEREREREI